MKENWTDEEKDVANQNRRILTELIDEARLQKRWIICIYQNIWFSPSEFLKEIENDRFLWSVDNFYLADPQNRIDELVRERDKKQQEIDNVIARMNR